MVIKNNLEGQMQSVTKATFRPATNEEINEAKGHLAWQCVNSLWTLSCKVMGTVEVYFKGANVLAWKTPLPQVLVEKCSQSLGYMPELPLVKRFYSFIGNRYIIDDKILMEALFSPHRNGEVFVNQSSFSILFDMLSEIFPDDNFNKEDFMFTCTEENTKKYRDLLHSLLKQNRMKEYTPDIQSKATEMLQDWLDTCQKGNSINSTEQTRLFASTIITQVMFGEDKSSKQIAEDINFVNYFIVQKLIRNVKAEHITKFKQATKSFRSTIEEVLQKTTLPLDTANKLSLAQKKAMIFVLLFAGQETTAALLNYTLWDLAKNPELQEKIRDPKELDLYFNVVFNKFNPAFGVGRRLKVDTCLEYKLEGDSQTRKVIMYKGETVSARIQSLAKTVTDYTSYNQWLPFGYGAHRCPGDQLAIHEIKIFIRQLVEKYTIATKQFAPITQLGYVTLQLADDINITIKQRGPVEKTVL